MNSPTIIAIDPGYDRCGVAILTEEDGKPVIIYSVCLTSDKNSHQHERLAFIYQQLENLVTKYKPEYLCIETLFFSVNKKTAFKVAEARGAILALAGNNNLSVIELSPQAIKIAMTGSGNATKEQVQKMVRLTVKLSAETKLDDEIDAIALGVASLQTIKLENLKKGLQRK
jgi:crossover junction endodeoxyribonuclease RuvC